MRVFPLGMRSTPTEIVGLNLHSLEIKSGVQAINYFVSLFTSDTPSTLLMKTQIKYDQSKVGIYKKISFLF